MSWMVQVHPSRGDVPRLEVTRTGTTGISSYYTRFKEAVQSIKISQLLFIARNRQPFIRALRKKKGQKEERLAR